MTHRRFVRHAPLELVVVHPGGLPAACWSRLAAQLPTGTPVTVLELEGITAYWEAGRDPEGGAAGVEALAERLRRELEDAPRMADGRVLLGWGFGGVVAQALAGCLAEPPEHVVVLDAIAPGAAREPAETELLRWFAMYLGARRGRRLVVDAARLKGGLDDALEYLLAVATQAGALREDTAPAALRRLYDAYARAVRRDHRLTAAYRPGAGAALTLVRAAAGLLPESRSLGWERIAPVEVLLSAGDHYTMLTDGASLAHLAALLRRWFAPVYAAA
jgi:thioesterase domain-containing protein